MSPSWLDYFFCTGPISTGSATANFSMDLMQYHLGRFIPFVWNRPINAPAFVVYGNVCKEAKGPSLEIGTSILISILI